MKKRTIMFASDPPVRPAPEYHGTPQHPRASAKRYTGKERDSGTGHDNFAAKYLSSSIKGANTR